MDEIIEGEIVAAHFVCIGGCGIVSDKQGKCNSVGCWRARNPLAECDCEDGKHTAFFEMYNPDVLKKKETDSSTS